MIGLNQNVSSPFGSEQIQSSRRRRTPSKYAQSIKQLTKMSSRNYQKSKNIENADEQSYLTNQSGSDKNNTLTCILPGRNKKLKLHVIIKKSPKNTTKKSLKVIVPDKPKQKEMPKNENLLDALLKLCKEHKMQEEEQNKQTSIKASEQVNSSPEYVFKQRRGRKGQEDEQKYGKMYQKYQLLNAKMEQIENETYII